MEKKVMLLGGNYFQTTAIKAAKELGCHVISVDYIPENPGHEYADEYYNISTTDREKVLELAVKLNIDGIISYASDVSAPTAAYVAEQMGLPTNPLSAVEIMTQKDRMRDFMRENGFLTPAGESFVDYKSGRAFFQQIKKPAMIKPVDASGSKGVSELYDIAAFETAWKMAKTYSRSGRIIIEEFIERSGYQIAGDAFLVDGEIRFAALMNEHFDHSCNPLVPIGESYPSVLDKRLKERALSEIQKLLSLLGMRMGPVNLDFLIDRYENVYILEIGPRSGGNLITDVIRSSGDADLARYTVLSALGEKVEISQNPDHGFVSSYLIHSLEHGIFKEIYVSDEIKKDIIQMDLWVKPGDKTSRFDNGSFGLGAALIRYDSIDDMCQKMDHMENYIRVINE